jgi:hypothetical protein
MAFPSKGDRVAHFQYGPGTITDMDVHHTVIDFDGFGSRRFVTSRVVLERTSDPGPTAAERKAVDADRAKPPGPPKGGRPAGVEAAAKSAARSSLRYYGGGHWKRPRFPAPAAISPSNPLRLDNAERL